MKKIFKISSMIMKLNYLIFGLILTSLFISCHPSKSYIMSTQAHLRTIEREDHQACVSQGIDFGDWSDVSTELYWRCRYNLIETKRIHNATRISDIKNNAMVEKISNKILENLQRSRQAILSNIENDIEVFDHSKCLSMGYSLDDTDQQKSQEYYECRRNLIKKRVAAPPNITNSYEASILPKKKFDQYMISREENRIPKGEVNFASNMVNKYPACREVNVKSKFFRKCLEAQNKSSSCLSKIQTVKAKKRLDDKIYCQQQSFVQFPDNYAITRNKSAAEIERLIQEQRDEQIRKLKEEKEAKVNRTLKFFKEGHVSKDKLFREEHNVKQEIKRKEELQKKIQILSLREEFVKNCNDLMEQKLPNFVKEEKERCISIGRDWNKRKEDEEYF